MQTKRIIPTDWKQVTLKEIGTFSKGAGVSKAELLPAGLNAIRYGEIYMQHHFQVKKISSFISEDSARVSQKIKSGDIIFAGSGETIDEIGKSAAYLYGEDCYAGGDTIIFTPKGCNSLFLSFLLNIGNARKELRELGQGQSVVHIYKKDIEELSISLPSLPEQKKIVEVLEAWDSYLEKLTSVIKCKKAIKKCLMQRLLEGKIRVPGFSKKCETKPLSFFVELELRPVPKPETKFKALGIRSHCKGTFQKLDFDPSKIAMDTLYEVQEDDLIINITFAWEGAIAIVKKYDEGGLVSHRFPTYTFKKHISDADYFKQYIQSKKFRHLLKLISPGGAGRNRVLSKRDFLKLKIQIPDYEEQIAIAQILTTVDRDVEALEKKKSLIEQQKKFLLNNLITGRIRLPEFIH